MWWYINTTKFTRFSPLVLHFRTFITVVVIERVPDSVALVWEHREHDPRHCPCHRRQDLAHVLRIFRELGIEALHGVGVEERHDKEHHKREDGVDEVPDPELVLGQVRRAVAAGPEASGGGDPVVDWALQVHVAVGEGRDEAGEPAEANERLAKKLVARLAVTVVSQERVEEVEHEDGSGGKELDEVPHPRDRHVLDAVQWARVA